MALLLNVLWVGAQEKHLTVEDAELGYYKGLYPSRMIALQWLQDTDKYVYMENNSIMIKNPDASLYRQLTLSDFQKVYPEINRVPYFYKITSSEIVFQDKNTYHSFDYLKGKQQYSIIMDEQAANHDFCDTNQKIAYTIDNNLYIASTDNAKEVVTQNEDKNIVAGQSIHRNEFGISKGTFWSPNGKYLAFYQKDESNVEEYPIVDITTYPATETPVKYPMAGRGSEQAAIGVYEVATKKINYLNIDTSDEHYLTNLGWSPDEKYITLAELNRAQNHMWLNVYEVQTGEKVRTIYEEKNDRWVEPETPALFLPNSNTQFLWMSEKDGFMNVYLLDLFTDSCTQITDFKFVVTEVLGFDEAGKNIYVEATGPDPKGLQVYKVNLKSKKSEKVTKEAGTHYTRLSPESNYLIDIYTSLSTPRNTGLLNLKDASYASLLVSENPLKDYQIGKTEFVKLKAQDGTDLEAMQVLPAHFDATKKYPVLVYVYGGPHAQLVTDSWLAGTRLWMQYMAAEQGYIVFTLDNRGSGNRGFEFESVIHREQGVAAMEDQVAGVNHLKSLPYVDQDRIAVHGWSYGGFMTISLLLNHPELFNTGVAGGPVTDWKYYEVMYGERYMDTPQENPEGYENTKVHNKIDKLDDPLLIIHGSVDDVVVAQHSMTLLKEAVEKNKPIDFFTYPMHQHNVRGRDRVHLMEKIVNYILVNNQ